MSSSSAFFFRTHMLLKRVWMNDLFFWSTDSNENLARRCVDPLRPKKMWQISWLKKIPKVFKFSTQKICQTPLSYVLRVIPLGTPCPNTLFHYIKTGVVLENTPLVKFIQIHIQDLNGVFSISSQQRYRWCHFLLFHGCLHKLSSCLWNKNKITLWLEDMALIFSC